VDNPHNNEKTQAAWAAQDLLNLFNY